jgi:uncharacterized protein (TIGR02466 family)
MDVNGQKNNIKSFDHLLFPELISAYLLDIQEETIMSKLKKLSYVELNEEKNNCFISSNNYLLNDIQWEKLKNIFNACIKNFIKDKLKYDINFKITESWATLTKQGGYANKHHHAHSFVSGVFYPSQNENTKLKIYKKYGSDFWSIKPKEYNHLNSDSCTICGEKNILLLFKSHLEHQIVKYEGVDDRYSIAFNVIPVGTIGEKTLLIEFS